MADERLEKARYAFWVLKAIDRFGCYGTDPKAKAAADLLARGGFVEEADGAWRPTAAGSDLLAREVHFPHGRSVQGS